MAKTPLLFALLLTGALATPAHAQPAADPGAAAARAAQASAPAEPTPIPDKLYEGNINYRVRPTLLTLRISEDGSRLKVAPGYFARGAYCRSGFRGYLESNWMPSENWLSIDASKRFSGSATPAGGSAPTARTSSRRAGRSAAASRRRDWPRARSRSPRSCFRTDARSRAASRSRRPG
jgi:hypothetical protein